MKEPGREPKKKKKERSDREWDEEIDRIGEEKTKYGR